MNPNERLRVEPFGNSKHTAKVDEIIKNTKEIREEYKYCVITTDKKKKQHHLFHIIFGERELLVFSNVASVGKDSTKSLKQKIEGRIISPLPNL